MTYKQALAYLNSLIDMERRPLPPALRVFQLDRMERMLAAAGNPHLRLRTVHVAGTKGKGSTAAMIARILQEAGYRVGLYTSPHLISFRERIRIGSRLIPERDVADLVERIRPIVEATRTSPRDAASFFEAYTLMGFIYYARKKVDCAVIETGLGGRLDATNVVTPLVSVITRIALDHTRELGRDLASIAREKAGIIKPGVPVVSAPQVAEAWRVLKAVARRQGAPLLGVASPCASEPLATRAGASPCLTRCRLDPLRRWAALAPTKIATTAAGVVFSLQGMRRHYPRLVCGLTGDHQIANAAAAVGAVELLEGRGFRVPLRAVEEGLRRVSWPGRLQVAGRRPWIILDAAHDEVSAAALARAVGALYPHRRLFLILGVSRDKDIRAIGRALCPIADEVIFTAARLPRAAPGEELRRLLGRRCPRHVTRASAATALAYARRRAGSGDLILVTGSIYIVGEALQALERAKAPR